MKFKKFMMLEADKGVGSTANSESTAENGGSAAGEEAQADVGDNEKQNNDIERLVQAKLDKAMADERKKNAALNKELEKMKREKMTADELKKYDDEKKDKALAEREKAILDKENRYYAITAIKKAGLDDGGDTALKVVDLVVGVNNEETDSKVSALNELVNKLVDAKVNEKFKQAGRIPVGGGSEPNKEKISLAEKLGKARAEQSKKSNEILKHYI